MKQLIIFILALILCTSLVSATNCCFGDTDGDCAVTGLDLINIKLYLLNKPVDFYCDILNADVDGNGALTALDQIQLQKHVLSKTPTISLVNPIGVPTNNAPVIHVIPTINFDQGATYTLPWTLDNYVIDKDNLPSEIIWNFNNVNTEVNVDLITKQVTFSSPIWSGTETFTVTATDPDENFDSTTLTITVNKITEDPEDPAPTGSSDGPSDTGSPNCRYKHFECTEWTDCQGHYKMGSQSRTCEKDKRCRGDYHPTELKSCDLIYTPEQEVEAETESNTNEEIQINHENINTQENPENITTRAITLVKENPKESATLGVLSLLALTGFLVYSLILKKH